MILRHATPLRNLPGIQRRGLLCSKSKGKLKVVWLHGSGKSAWAVLHTVRRHGGKIEAVVILEVQVPRDWLCRSKEGLWYCRCDIPPEQLGKVITFAELARSPAKKVA